MPFSAPSPRRPSPPPPAAASPPPPVAVRRVSSPAQLADFRAATCAYLEWLGEDLGFQGVERELASLPGSYAEEHRGAMLLAYDADPGAPGGEACVGAVALRPLAGHTATLGVGDAVGGVPLPAVCEMKRLFVLPGHHGRGAGAALVRALLEEGARLGYRLMVLDTLERLASANRLYAALGFAPCPRYNDCPLPGVLYFSRALGGGASTGTVLRHADRERQQQADGGSGGGSAGDSRS
eukprot:scaffold18.g2050.t1